MMANGCRVSFWDDENGMKLESVVIAQLYRYT